MDSIHLEHQLKTKPGPCIWMQAEVVQRKYCLSDYSCHTCRFDRTLRRVCYENDQLIKQGKIPKGKKGQIVFWVTISNNLDITLTPAKLLISIFD